MMTVDYLVRFGFDIYAFSEAETGFHFQDYRANGLRVIMPTAR